MYLGNLIKMVKQLNQDKTYSCNDNDINLLQNKLGLILPECYLEFLKWMGRGAEQILEGSFCFYDDIIDVQKDARELLKSNKFPKTLPEDAFVFWFHQGYQFLFCNLTEGENPSVHYYNENEHKHDFQFNIYASFGEFLAREIVGHYQLMEYITNRDNGIKSYYTKLVEIHPRFYDAEAKVMESIAQDLNVQPGKIYYDTGTVNLGSEQPICISCKYIIKRFNDIFPNVKITSVVLKEK